MMLRMRELLLVLGVMLWTAALVPAWDRWESGEVIHKRFCMGWWNSPLVESIEKIDEAETATVPYSGVTNIKIFSWSALAFVLGTLAFFVRDRIKIDKPKT